MTFSDYIDNEAHKALCTAHNPAVWEDARMSEASMNSDYSYTYVIEFECGHIITRTISMRDFVSADDPLFQIVEGGSKDALAAWIIEHEGD